MGIALFKIEILIELSKTMEESYLLTQKRRKETYRSYEEHELCNYEIKNLTKRNVIYTFTEFTIFKIYLLVIEI